MVCQFVEKSTESTFLTFFFENSDFFFRALLSRDIPGEGKPTPQGRGPGPTTPPPLPPTI